MGGALTILLKLSLLGSALAGLLLLLRPLLRRQSSKALSYYLWLLVLLRLCVPLGLTIPLPAADAPTALAGPAVTMDQTVPTPAPVQGAQEDLPTQGAPAAGSAAPDTPDLPSPSPAPVRQAKLPPSVLWTAAWLLGTLVCLGRYVWGYVRFSRTIRRSARAAAPEAQALLRALDPRGRVRLLESSLANTPMVLGAFRAAVVLPVGVTDAAQLGDILIHELTHVRRHDLLYKWFAAAVTSLHWFNPLTILIRREIGRACELSCDEAVMRSMDDAGRRHYGETLLALAASSHRLPALALCEEKERLKERLVSIVKYKKRGPAAAVLSLLLAVLIAGCAAISGAQPSPAASGNGDADALLEDVTLYETNGMTIAFPNDVYDQLLIFPGTDEDTLVTVFEKASYEQAQADWGEGTSAGLLFAISRKDQAQYEQFLMADGIGQSHFARDDAYYYCWETPTDVQLYRSGGLFTEEEVEVWQTLNQRLENVKGDFTARNGLTPYDDSEFFARDLVYDGEHLYASFDKSYFDGAAYVSMTLVLSQPVKQGAGGIWCVERWYDNDTGNDYLTFCMEGSPQDQGIAAAEHYQQLQDAADAGERSDLLYPQQAAVVWLQNYWSDTDAIDPTPEDVTLLEGEPAGNLWPRIYELLAQDGQLATTYYLDGMEYDPYYYKQPADWAEQNMTLAWMASVRLSSILWCKAEPPQTLTGNAVVYAVPVPNDMSTPLSGDKVIFFEDGLVCIHRNGPEGTEEFFRPLRPSDDPYVTMYLLCQEWASYDDTGHRFSYEEVNAAIDIVAAKFEEWSNYCILDYCGYDPAYSLQRAQWYLEHGRGSENGASEENVIVLNTSFTTRDEGAVQDTAWEPDTVYTWDFFLIREDEQSPWVLDDWGY